MTIRDFTYSSFRNLLMVSALTVSCTSYGLAQYAVEVVSYDQGTTAAGIFGSTPPAFFNQQTVALGSPERFTGENSAFPGVVSPFSPPFAANEIVSVGETGHITLRLSNFVIPQSGEPEIGVFTNSGLIDSAFPNGIAGDPVEQFGVDSADVSVSADGTSWVSLGNIVFDGITNGYNDLADMTDPSDFQQPFTTPSASFAGLNLSDGSSSDILSILNGSGGGTWLDISGTGLNEVGYIRFRVADDNDATMGQNFELDAVSIASSAVGPATVPEPSSAVLLALAGLAMVRLRRR